MKRSHDPGKHSNDFETLQHFEEQLRALKPRASSFAAVSPPRATRGFRGWMATRWAVAASLLFMWGMGASMGAAAALAWVGSRPATSTTASSEEKAFDTAIASSVESPNATVEPTQVNAVPSESAELATVQLPVAPVVSPAGSPGRLLPQFVTYPWRAARSDQPLARGTLSPLSAYRTADSQSGISVDAQQLWGVASEPDKSESLFQPGHSMPESMADYQPSLGKNQRELLRGLLDSTTERIF